MKSLLFLLVSLVLVCSASAQVFIWDNEGNNAQIIGPRDGVQSYWDSKGTTGLILPPTEDRRVGSFQFRTPDGQFRYGTITAPPPLPSVEEDLTPMRPVPSPRSFDYRIPKIGGSGVLDDRR
jgi:hypothetical protein